MPSLLRFTLDLFSPESPELPALLPLPVAGPKKKRRAPVRPTLLQQPEKPPQAEQNPYQALIPPAQAAIENIARAEPVPVAIGQAGGLTGSIQTLADACEPASARHPRANREAVLGTLRLAYELRRGKRRTIGFSVSADGLTVSAPRWVRLGDIDDALREKSGWILKKLQEVRARHDRLAATRIDWKDGAELPFLGRPVRVVLDPRHDFAGVGAELQTVGADAVAGLGAPDAVLAPPARLLVGLPHTASPEQIRDVVQAWLMRQATRVFTERLQHFAPQLGVSWRKLTLSSAGTRWGSASVDGSIRLHWRLIHFRQPVIDYVVVHELSHLRVMDHSPRFWDTVRAVVPDYAGLRAELKEESIARW